MIAKKYPEDMNQQELTDYYSEILKSRRYETFSPEEKWDFIKKVLLSDMNRTTSISMFQLFDDFGLKMDNEEWRLCMREKKENIFWIARAISSLSSLTDFQKEEFINFLDDNFFKKTRMDSIKSKKIVQSESDKQTTQSVGHVIMYGKFNRTLLEKLWNCIPDDMKKNILFKRKFETYIILGTAPYLLCEDTKKNIIGNIIKHKDKTKFFNFVLSYGYPEMNFVEVCLNMCSKGKNPFSCYAENKESLCNMTRIILSNNYEKNITGMNKFKETCLEYNDWINIETVMEECRLNRERKKRLIESAAFTDTSEIRAENKEYDENECFSR